MGSALVRFVLDHNSGRSDDRASIGVAITGTDDAADITGSELHTLADTLYNTTPGGGTHPLGYYIGKQMSRASDGLQVNVYDLAPSGVLAGTSPMGSPVSTYTQGITASASVNPLPSECAAVVSFKADYTGALEESGATRPRARRRARVFLGPLDSATLSAPSSAYIPVLASGFITDALAVFGALETALEGVGSGWGLGVWSRKDATIRAVVDIGMDSQFDTQRRRGERSTGITWIGA